MTEFELKFQVPPDSRAAVEAALRRGRTQRERLQARYFDTADEALRRHGVALRLRKEGRHWVQAAKAAGGSDFARLEHEVPLGGTRPVDPDPSLHAGTPVGERLAAALAASSSPTLVEVFETDIVRLKRVVEAGGAAVELAFDEGRLRAEGREHRVCELEFELKRGRPTALVELAQRWCERHALWLDPLSKAAAGWRLAHGTPGGPPVHAGTLEGRPADTAAWLRQAVGSALRQVLGNAREIAAGFGEAEHVHQMRVGLRRLRTLLRELRDLQELTAIGAGVEAALATSFQALGRHRDLTTLVPALHRQLATAGGPAPAWSAEAPDVLRTVREPALQLALLRLLGWMHETEEPEAPGSRPLAPVRKQVATRLQKLWQHGLDAGREFAVLPEPQRHQVRKRLKRLRYLAELARPLFPAAKVDRFTEALKPLQDALGEYQDAAAARQLWRAHVEEDPGAWFGAGWLAAREEALAQACGKACRRARKDLRPFW